MIELAQERRYRELLVAVQGTKPPPVTPIREIGWWERKEPRVCVRVVAVNGQPLSRMSRHKHVIVTWLLLHGLVPRSWGRRMREACK